MTPPVESNTILLGYRGSHAHGTYIDPDLDPEFGTDDIDLMGVVVPPESYYLGLDSYGSRGTKEIVDGPYDIVYYELRKFVSLLCKGNPNVLSLLWLQPRFYHRLNFSAILLTEERNRFTFTKQTVKAHMGYALAQRHQMQKDPTNRAYMGERRRALAQRFGYDVKHAAHFYRLLAQVIELMEDEFLNVNRHDAETLKEIKTGQWSLDRFMLTTGNMLNYARQLEARCGFPDSVNHGWASSLCVQIVKEAWEENERSP